MLLKEDFPEEFEKYIKGEIPRVDMRLDDLLEKLNKLEKDSNSQLRMKLKIASLNPSNTAAAVRLNYEQKKARAVLYPIASMIDVNSAGFAPCAWHNEKSPSMKFYPKTNSVYCFGCNKGGDSIALYMALVNCDFKTAVNSLS